MRSAVSYTEFALHPKHEFGWRRSKENAQALGYASDWLERLPDVVWESPDAVGNPFSIGPIHPGENIIDLGCGAGTDVCVAAMLVGDRGRVIDITRAAIEVLPWQRDILGDECAKLSSDYFFRERSVSSASASVAAWPIPSPCASLKSSLLPFPSTAASPRHIRQIPPMA